MTTAVTTLDGTDRAGFPLADGTRAASVAWRASRGRRRLLVGAILLMTMSSMLDLVVPYQAGVIVDAVRHGLGPQALTVPAILMVASIVAAGVAGGAGIALAPMFFATVLARLRERMLAVALGLPQQRVERAGTADLVSRVGDDVSRARDAGTMVIPRIVSTGILVIVSAAGIGRAHPAFLLAIGFGAAGYVLLVRWYWPRASAAYVAERAASADHAGHVLTTIHGLDTVRAFGLEEARLGLVSAGSWLLVERRLRGRRLITTLTLWLLAIEALTIVASLGIGAHLSARGLVSVGEASAAVLILVRVFGPVRFILFFLDDFQAALVALRRIVGVLDTPAREETQPAPAASAAPGDPLPPGAVELRGVSFAYVPGHHVLRDVDVRLDPGTVVALVGPSGAGKSTLSAIVAGLLPPTSGQVRIGRAEQGSSGRARPDVVMVSQHIHTFSGPLRDDVLLACPPDVGADSDRADSDRAELDRAELDRAELLRGALARTGAADWVEALPAGADTVIGRLGHQLTPAHAQHLALTRVLVADPAIVVLDEATAEAGSGGARVLDAAAAAVVSGRTALVVAHRLGQVTGADRIVVMADGRIVDDGPPQELICRPGPFFDLWHAWRRDRQSDPSASGLATHSTPHDH